MTVPTKQDRAEWRTLAEKATFVSAIDEYCPPEFLILLDAVDALETDLDGHRKHVGQFLSDLHAIMIDPLAEGTISVKDMCVMLLKQATQDREALRRLHELEAPANEPDPRPCYLCGFPADRHPWELYLGGRKRGRCPTEITTTFKEDGDS